MEQPFTFEFLLIVILLIALSLGAIYVFYDKKRGRKKEDQFYMEGLKFMAQGENRRAVEKFKEAVRTDSTNIDAYLKIGIILRGEGLTNNAIRVHKDLLLRGNLTIEEINEVKKNLALDYWEAGNFDSAEKYLDELKANKLMFEWTAPYLLKLYEKRADWEKAISLFNEGKMAGTQKGKAKLAIYKVNHGTAVAREKDERSGRIVFKEAIKHDKECAEGYLALGDSYMREDRASDAITAWNNLCKNIPAKAQMAFERLEKALYEKGQFSKIEELYSGILADNESDVQAIIALSDIYRKKGEYNDAMKLLQQAQKKDLDESRIKTQMVKVMVDKSQFKEAAKLALEILDVKHPDNISVTNISEDADYA